MITSLEVLRNRAIVVVIIFVVQVNLVRLTNGVQTSCAAASKFGENLDLLSKNDHGKAIVARNPSRFKRSSFNTNLQQHYQNQHRQIQRRQASLTGNDQQVSETRTSPRCQQYSKQQQQSSDSNSRVRSGRQSNRFGTVNNNQNHNHGSSHNHNNNNIATNCDEQNHQGNNQNHNNNNNNNNQQQQGEDPTSRAKIIETAVFIDQALDNKFNGVSNGLVELNKLIKTMMNQVQLLFKYSSLSVPIGLKLVLVEHIKESERQHDGLQAPNSARGDIDVYLSNFCNWQQRRLEREKRLWWDHAILLSGLDLYKQTPGKNHSGVLGLAWVGGMCKGNYSCTINEASNFESSFVIAHEIGHSLGIMHDGQKNRCDPNGFIMSEKTGAGKIHWSRCSNNYLKESIAKGQLKCLDSEQNGQIDSLYDLSKLRSPGQVYTIREQCRLAFGNNYTEFVTHESPFNTVCRELWCRAGNSAKAAHPALEGSSCGDLERVCREGRCI